MRDSESTVDFRALLNHRLKRPQLGILGARTTLRHFALVNYAVSPKRLSELIPDDVFEVMRFETNEGQKAFLSTVLFQDVDFNFSRFASGIKFKFYQTNHRAYVVKKKTGEPAVWFFGTNLGSRWVRIPRVLWKMPWHKTDYKVECNFDATRNRYEKYDYQFTSEWCSGRAKISDTGEPVKVLDGFSSMDEMKFILTQPERGFYRRSDGKIGSYRIWHQEMNCTLGKAKELFFDLYEKLNLMTKAEMQNPHSIFICPQIEFEIHLPPQIISSARESGR